MTNILTTDALGLDAKTYEPVPVTNVGELRARIADLPDEHPLVFVTGLVETPVVLSVADGAVTVNQPFPAVNGERPETFVITVGVQPETLFEFVFGAIAGGEADAATGSEADEAEEVTL